MSSGFDSQIRNKGTEVCTQRLQRIQALRVDPAAAIAVAPINAEYLQQFSQFPHKIEGFWLAAVATWVAGCAVLWLVGWSVAWIKRGFTQPAS
jgi:Na+-driven multidrug efflux pump